MPRAACPVTCKAYFTRVRGEHPFYQSAAMKFLPEDETVEYKGYSINSRLDSDSVRELVESLIADRKLFYAEDPRAMAVQDPFEVELEGEEFVVIISSKFIRLEHLKGRKL